jgi:putative MATE family efflux protein
VTALARTVRGARPGATDREIFRLAVPAFFALVAEPLYVLTDTAIVGHLGTVPLAGLSAASAVLLALYSIFIFLAYGTTAAVARLIGAGDHRRAAHDAVQGLWLAFACGVVVALVGFAFATPLIHAFTGDPAVREQALIYLRISLFGIPAMLLTLAGVGYLRGLQDTRRPLVVALTTAFVNLVVEVVLIYGLGFGIGASAVSTVIAQWLGTAVYLWWITSAVRVHAADLRPHGASIVRLAKVGGWLMARTIAIRGSFLIAAAAAARIGTVALAAHEIAFQMLYLLALVLDAIAIAGQSLVGRWLGAGDGDAARSAAARMIGWSVVFGVVVAVLLVSLRTVLPHVFSGDPAVQALTAFLLLHTALMQPMNGALFALDGILIGAGDQRFLAFATLGAAAIFVPAVVLVRTLDAGIGWLWFAVELLMLARLVPLIVRFREGGWIVLGAPARS